MTKAKSTPEVAQVVIPGEHELKESIVVDVWYPNHAPRTTSNTFTHTRDKLIADKVPCWICGTLDELEIHHFHVEWAFAEGVDWDKMKVLHSDFDWTTFKEAEDFVDSPYNMMVLCETHHRHLDHGIHNLPYPIWVMQRHGKKDFQMFSPIPTPTV